MGEIILSFAKGETFFISSNNQVLLGIISWCRPPSWILQKGSSPHLQFGPEENIPRHSFQVRAYLLICFESYQSFPYSYKQSKKRMVNTLLMVNISPHYQSFLSSTKKKKLETRFVSSASREQFGIKNRTFLPTNWQKTPFGKMNC